MCKEVSDSPFPKKPHYFSQMRCVLEMCTDPPTPMVRRGCDAFHPRCKKFITLKIHNRMAEDRATQRVPPDGARSSLLGFLPRAGTGSWQQNSTQLLRVSTSSSLAAGTPSRRGRVRAATEQQHRDPRGFLELWLSSPLLLKGDFFFLFFLGSCFSGAGGTALQGGCRLGCGGLSGLVLLSTNCWSCL